MTKTFTAYHFIDLVDSTETLFKCSECLELFEIDVKLDPAVEAKLHRLRERKASLEAAIRKKSDLAMQAKREAAVEADLAKLKRKLPARLTRPVDLESEATSPPESAAPAAGAARSSQWRSWFRRR